jgi:hypothetical protein
MTLAQILANGWQMPTWKIDANGMPLNPAAATYKINASIARFTALTEMAVARRSKIRAAHRRWLRKTGQPLSPLPPSSKYRAKGRR